MIQNRLLRAKGIQLLHGSFLLFNSANLGHSGTLVKKCRQLLQLVRSADGVNLYPAIILISNPTADPEIVRILRDEPAEPDALHSSRHKPSPRLKFQRADSLGRPGLGPFTTASIACRKLWTVKGLGIRRNPLSRT
jgi:hypothetical protein